MDFVCTAVGGVHGVLALGVTYIRAFEQARERRSFNIMPCHGWSERIVFMDNGRVFRVLRALDINQSCL